MFWSYFQYSQLINHTKEALSTRLWLLRAYCRCKSQYFRPSCSRPLTVSRQDVEQRSMQLKYIKTPTARKLSRQSYLDSVTHKSSNYYCCQAEGNHSILHVLHHSRKDDEVGVECVEDRAVDVSPLKRGKKTVINCASRFCATAIFVWDS